MNRRLTLLLVALVGLVSAACGGDDGPEPVTLTVFTDLVVKAPVEELVATFEAENPDVRLELVVASTEELAERLRAGEHADMIIGERQELDQLGAEEIILGERLLLGTDLIEITVPPGNPAGVIGLDAFLPDSPIRTAICAEDTWCGGSARIQLHDAGIEGEPDIVDATPEEILTLLADREVDASILWRTHAARADPPLDSVAIPLEYEYRRDFSVAGVEDDATIERTVRWFATDDASAAILVDRGLRPREDDGS